MSADCKHIVAILKRDGTGRPQRTHDKLNPDHLKLHGFDIHDWLIFAYNFSRHVRFHPKDSASVPKGDWKNFFQIFTDNQQVLDNTTDVETLASLRKELEGFILQAEEEKNLTPHLTLYITFLKLLEKSRERFNQLNKRHLDFYYQQVLDIQKKPLTPDKVYVIFELAKKTLQTKIDEGTALDAGKDEAGKNRIYTVIEEAVLNQANVSALKSVYHDIQQPQSQVSFSEDADKSGHIVAAPMVNSLDGIGEEFPDGKVQWWPFGYTQNCYGSTFLTPLPAASLGFSLSSPLFNMKEGRRTITLRFIFQEGLPTADTDNIRKAIHLQLTGEKEWWSHEDLLDPSTEMGAKDGKGELSISFTLSTENPAIIPYDKEIHEGNYENTDPMVRIVFRTERKEGYNLYRVLQDNELLNIHLHVQIHEVKGVQLENDQGRLNAAKPFYPFTPRPVKGSSLRIYYPEAMEKPWDNMVIEMDWLNTPDDFSEHYKAYGPLETSSFKGRGEVTIPNSPVSSHHYFTVNQSPGPESKENLTQSLFIKETAGKEGEVNFRSEFSFSKPLQFGKDETLKLTLNKTFLHEKYGHFYTLATIRNGEGLSLEDIPNEPYTPLAENLVLSYTASSQITLDDTHSFEGLKIFHEEPFGHYLAYSGDSNDLQNKSLVPDFKGGGALYIGIENAVNLQQISLLFQLREGSENPVHHVQEENSNITWEVLGKDTWIPLTPSQILQDQTRNFLKTGIFKFILPKEAENQHHRMPSGYHWLRARTSQPSDAVCQMIAVHTQAVEALFQPYEGQVGDHLDKGLAENSISKLKQRLGTVKSVSQPFPSFGGKEEEKDVAYYRRVSERLRHKSRAITLWDYEHLILEQFPQIYKVKCLNHTSEASFQSPGEVTLIVVPDTVRQSVYDIYQPRVSKATLEEVSQFINHLNSFHVQAKVINPQYEEVKVSLRVQFRKGFDEHYYQLQLQEDINKYLSPWAYDQKATVEFGITLHRSLFIHYLEQLPYLDYLEDLKFMMRTKDQSNPCYPTFEEVANHAKVEPSSPKAILVSAKSHHIQLAQKHCVSHSQEKQ